jgi:hypothetical protein
VNQLDQKKKTPALSPEKTLKRRRIVRMVIVVLFFLVLFSLASWLSQQRTAALQAEYQQGFTQGYKDGEATAIAKDATATTAACITPTITPIRAATGIASCSTLTPTP